MIRTKKITTSFVIRKMKAYIKKISLSFLLTLVVLYNQLSIVALAEEIPNRDNMSQDIQQAVTSTIMNTGDNPQTDTAAQNTSATEVNNDNQVAVTQTVQAEANTGYNEASRNISIGGNAGMITTGNAVVNTTLQANVNNNATAVGGSGGGSAAQGSVINTGDGVSPNTTANSTLNTYVTNKNTTYINQLVNSSANTGNNIADRNISIGGQSGVITTGAALTSTNYLVTVNGSVALIGGTDNGHGPGSGASIVLLNTGDNSRFGINSRQYTNSAVSNDNQAVINQLCASCIADTGHNVASRNINRGGDAGVIQTKNAVVNVSLLALANTNQSYVNGGSSGSPGQSNLTNTGDNVNTDTNSNSSTNTAINNTNQAQVNQSVNAKANTGYNVANRNISIGGDAGVITTGNAVIKAILSAILNSNTTQVK